MGVVTAHRKAASVNKHQGISVRFFVRIIYPYRNRPDGAFHLCIDNFERLGPALVPEFTFLNIFFPKFRPAAVGVKSIFGMLRLIVNDTLHSF